MKKQLRFVLFAVLVLVMVFTMALMASATETPAPAATDNYQVVDASGTHVGYYATLTDALTGVTADGYKIIVLKDVTEATGVKLDKAFTYTITGGAEGKTIAFADTVRTSRGTAYYTYIDLVAGAVTLENLTLDTSATPTKQASEYVSISKQATALTLDGITASGKATSFVYAQVQMNITVKGDTNLNFEGNVFYFFAVANKVHTLTVEGGTYVAKGNFVAAMSALNVTLSDMTVSCTDGSVVAFTQVLAKDSVVKIEDGADITTTSSVFSSSVLLSPAATITVEPGAKLTGKTIFEFTGKKSGVLQPAVNVTLNGGEFHVVGADGKLANEATVFATFTMGTDATANNTKIYFDDGAAIPDVTFDTYFNWNKISVAFSGVEAVYEIKEAGTYELTSLDCDFYKLMQAAVVGGAVDATRFPNAILDLSGFFIPIIVNHPDAVLNISGTYELGNDFLVRVLQGTVNVNGSFSGGASGNLFVVEGGTLNIVGGTYETDGTPFAHKGGTIVIENGTFAAQTLIDSNVPTGTVGEVCIKAGTITAATVVKVQGAGSVTVEGGTYTTTATGFFDAPSGTLNIEGGSFTGTVLVEAATATLNISGGTFNLEQLATLTGAATLNVLSGTFNLEQLATLTGATTLNVSGGTYTVNKVVEITTAATVTVSGGTYQSLETSGATYFVLNHADAKLNISGGTYTNVAVGIHALKGELTVSGGHFTILTDCKGIFVDGEVVVSVTANADNAENDPVFLFRTYSTSYKSGSIFISANAASAKVSVSGGTFGASEDLVFASSKSCFAIWCEATIKAEDFIISGGTFRGSTTYNGTIVLKKAGAGLTITGGTFYGYRNVLMWYKSTVNISGGSFNSANYSFVHVHGSASSSILNISGGEFNGYSYAVRVSSASTVTITGGTFTQKESATENQAVVFNETAGATITIGEIKTVGEGDEAQEVVSGPTVHLQTVGNIIRVSGDLAATVTVNGGTFALSEGNLFFNVTTQASIKKLTINGGSFSLVGGATLVPVLDASAVITVSGGSFSLSGEGTALLPSTYDVAGSTVTVSGGHVTVADDAALPMYLNIDTSKLSVAINGNISTLVISAPLTGEDTVIDTPAEQIAAIRAYFTNVTFGEGVEEAFEWVDRIILNHKDAILLLKDKDYTINSDYLVRVAKGTLRIEGGNYTVTNGAKLFIVEDGATEATVTVTGITLTLGNRSSYILDVADNTIIVKGFSELKFTAAGEYNIASYADIGELLRPVLEGFFTHATIGAIEIESWVPITLDGEGVVLNVTGGEFTTDGDYFFRVVNGVLNVSGGTFSGAAKAIYLTGGALNITGGHIFVPKASSGVYIDGAATVTVDGDAVIELLDQSEANTGAFVTTANANGALLTINNGKFGNVNVIGSDSFFALYLANDATTVTINGGQFYGGTSSGAIIVKGGTLNITGGEVYGYRNLYITEDAIINISGGSFNPLPGQGNTILIHITAANTVLNITGGEFNRFMNAIRVAAAATVNVKAGTFTPRESTVDTDVVILVQKSGVVLTIGEIVEGVSSGPVAPMGGKTNLLRVKATSDDVEVACSITLTINGGTFMDEGAGKPLIVMGDLATFTSLEINGGTFEIAGAGLELISTKFDTAGTPITVAGGHVILEDGATLPMYAFIDTSALKVTVNTLLDNLVIKTAGTYTFANVADQLNIIKAYFSEMNFGEGIEEAMTFMRITLNHQDAVVILENLTLTATNGALFRLVAGELRLVGGTYTVGANGALFDLQGNAKLSISGGTYLVKGINSKFMNVADGVDTSGVSMDNVALTLGALGALSQSPLELSVGASSLDSLVVNGLAGLTFDKAQEYVINSIEDIEEMIRVPLAEAGFAENLVVELTTWVPISINNAGAVVTVTGGTYISAPDSEYMFELNAGKLHITGGEFTALAGDFIFVSGGGTEVIFGTAGDNNNYPTIYAPVGGNVIHVNKVQAKIAIYNGHFIKSEIDRAAYTSPLIYFANVSKDAAKASVLDIYGGYFEATRILMDYRGMTTTTIYGGIFKSNFVRENMTDADFTVAYFEDLAASTKANPFVFNPQTHVVTTDTHFFNLMGLGSSLTIYGGEIDGGLGSSIIYCNGDENDGVFLYGGSFTGAKYWFRTNRIVNLTIGSHERDENNMPVLDASGKPVAGTIAPQFEAKGNITQYGFYFSRSGDIAADNTNYPEVVITAGTFTMKDLVNRRMWNFETPITLDIYGGSFTISMDNAIKDADRTVNSRIFYIASGGKLDINIYGGSFVAAQVVLYRYGGGTMNIYDGTFHSNYKGTALASYGRMFQMSHNDTTINVYGGNIKGDKCTYAIFSMNVATGNSMYLNIYGGTISGGGKWFHANQPGHVLIDKNPLSDNEPFEGFVAKNPEFKELSVKSSATVYGFYLDNAFKGGTFEVRYLKTTLDSTTHATALFVIAGGEVTLAPAERNDIKVDVICNVIRIASTFSGHVTIKGGQYTTRDVAAMFVFSTKAVAADNPNLMNSTFTIENGTFKAFENSVMFNVSCEVPEYTFRILNGTFESENAATFMLKANDGSLDGMKTNFIIENGSFTSKAPRMIYLDHTSMPLVINGGTFRFEDREGITDDDAIIYAAGKTKATILIKGGIFVDNRTENDQSILKMNDLANIRLEGDFRLYVVEKKPYFMKDTITPAYSIPMLESNLDTYKNESYYACFGYCFNDFAPVMLNRPEIRPVLGAEGITFTSSISAANAAYLATLGTVSYGTLIFPTDELMDGWQNGTDFLQALEGCKYVTVEAKNGIVTEADGSLTIRASLINIKEKNYTKSFTGIAYAKVVDDAGNETYYWATHVTASVSTTMREVAEHAINDTNGSPLVKNGRTYCYVSIMKDKTYSRYASVFQNALRKYLPATVKPKS